MRITNFYLRQYGLALFIGLFFTAAIHAQTTTFTFQSNLPREITPATDTFEMEVKLFDTVTGGTQIGATNSIAAVEVKNRAFTVWLDFGAAAFPGADRFLEVSVRRSGSGEPFTTLAPRTQILSVPYAIRALNATTADNALSLNGVDVNDFVLTTDSRLSDSRNPNPGSNNYIQNTTTQQTGANFNIDGNGTAGGTLSGSIVNAATRFDIGGLQVLSVAGFGNLFVGRNAGDNNTTGNNNSFVGTLAGRDNTSGFHNSFVGVVAGFRNTTGFHNSFFGSNAGDSNTTGGNNSFVGFSAGFSNTTGFHNSFVGVRTGFSNTTGFHNSFFGSNAGASNTTGNNNTIIGTGADVGSNNLSFATAIGANAVVGQSNTIALGRSDGSDKVRVFGLGAAGSTQLCRNADNEISTCSSSLRYKTNIAPFSFGLSFINQLRPISYKWKDGGMKDIGFGAEDVARVNPLFVAYNAAGEVEGVKYERLSAVFVNAFKEQQAQIEVGQKENERQKDLIVEQETQIKDLRKQLQQQQILIERMKKAVCQQNPQAEVCQEEIKNE